MDMIANEFIYYPARLIIDEGVYCLRVKTTSSNIGINAEGDTLEQAVKEAKDVIYSMASLCLSHKEPAPAAASAEDGDIIIQMPADFALKCMLRNVMLQKGISVSALAKMLGFKRPQQAFNMLTFDHSTALDKLFPIFSAIGSPLQINC